MSVKAMSLRHRLMWLIILSVGLSWTVMFVWSFHSALREVTQWDEARLIQLGPLLVELNPAELAKLAEHGIDTRNEVPRHPQRPKLDSDYDDRFVHFQVTDRQGQIIARSSDLPIVRFERQPVGSVEKVAAGSAVWLMYTMRDTHTGRTISLMEPANEHSDLASGVAARIARPAIVLLPVLMLLAWFSIGIGLRPLTVLSHAMQARNDRNLQPIEIASTPGEIEPVITATNALLERLRTSLARERTFTADAAHELKTPLTAIKVQAQVAMSSRDSAQQILALERVALGVDRGAHLVEQLLLLARLDDDEKIAKSRLRLHDVITEAMVFRKHLADEKKITLRLTGDGNAELQADCILVRALLDNLLDNAVKYGEVGGTVETNVKTDDRYVYLMVRDDGPGVSREEMTRLADRFFRSSSARATGSGLGLSIVNRIAAHFGADLKFSCGIEGRGLAVCVVFPSRPVGLTLAHPSSKFKDTDHRSIEA